MTKPLLFLDVDGVLLCFNPEAEGTLKERLGQMIMPTGTKERVKRLADEFEIVWCTAWFGSAHPSFREQLELPETSWPYVPWTNHKLTDILKWAKGRPWVWVDDDIQFELDDLGWTERHLPDNCRLQEIDGWHGLTDKDVDQIFQWKESL